MFCIATLQETGDADNFFLLTLRTEVQQKHNLGKWETEICMTDRSMIEQWLQEISRSRGIFINFCLDTRYMSLKDIFQISYIKPAIIVNSSCNISKQHFQILNGYSGACWIPLSTPRHCCPKWQQCLGHLVKSTTEFTYSQ